MSYFLHACACCRQTWGGPDAGGAGNGGPGRCSPQPAPPQLQHPRGGHSTGTLQPRIRHRQQRSPSCRERTACPVPKRLSPPSPSPATLKVGLAPRKQGEQRGPGSHQTFIAEAVAPCAIGSGCRWEQGAARLHPRIFPAQVQATQETHLGQKFPLAPCRDAKSRH